jgi:hypothetical protein
MGLTNFLKYNNTVPIVISLLLLSAGGAYAAANPDAILSQQQEVTGVDNSYIVNKDLAAYTPTVEITNVIEDAESYTVEYRISTIDIDNYVWKDIMRQERMEVDKTALKGKDLGLYVTGQLKNIIDNQLAYLHDVQEKERKQVSRAVVSTTYGGLIGKLLSDKTEELPGYVPVVAPVVEQNNNVASVAAATPEGQSQGAPSNSSAADTTSAPPQTSSSLTLQVLGNNPANIPLHSSYADLGAVVIDPRSPNLGYYTYQNGNKVDSPIIDTSKPDTFTIEYRATDVDGVVVTATRTVLVAGGASAAEPEVVPAVAAENPATSTPEVVPEVVPEATSTLP